MQEPKTPPDPRHTVCEEPNPDPGDPNPDPGDPNPDPGDPNPDPGDPNPGDDVVAPGKEATGDVNSSGCGYALTPDQRFELIKAGFLLTDANQQGFNFFSRIENVWTQSLYFFVEAKKHRAVFMTTPSILKDYVGLKYSCGAVYGFPVGEPTGAKLQIFSLTQVAFTEK